MQKAVFLEKTDLFIYLYLHLKFLKLQLYVLLLWPL